MMRIRLEGPVTTERINLAIQRAAAKMRWHGIEATPVGAVMQVQFRDQDGKIIPIDALPEQDQLVVVKRDERIVGTVVQKIALDPALAASKEAIEAPAVSPAPKPKELAKLAIPKAPKKTTHAVSDPAQEAARINQERAEQTRLILKHFAYNYVCELNRIVDEVWSELKPISYRRPNVGQPIPKPRFSELGSKSLHVCIDTRAKPCPIISLAGKMQDDGESRQPWQTKEWAEVIRRSEVVTNTFYMRALDSESRS